MSIFKTLNKKTLIIFIILILAIAMVLGTCFSPYGADMGTLTVSIGDSSRAIWQGNEYLDFEHEVILIGPSGTWRQTFTGSGTARFSVTPGTYSINVRAIGDRPAGFNGSLLLADHFPARMLRAYGLDSVQISTGQTNDVYIDMLPATEVINESQFWAALTNAGSDEEYILIKNDIEFSTEINLNKNITLIAEDTVTISRPASFGYFFRLSNVHLKLGAMGMRGQLVLDGRGNLIITDVPSSTNIITMYDGVTLRNGGSSAINTSGTFNMHGGIITGIDGRGVDISEGGIFNMHGGIISNNKSSGVSVGGSLGQGTTFNMYGGVISNNTRNGNGGGGVDVSGGDFNMAGGIISGNTSSTTTNAFGITYIYGGGVNVREFSGIRFRKTGGIIYGNNAGANSNRVIDASIGHAVYVAEVTFGGIPRDEKWFNTTVEPGVILDSETNANWQFN